MKALILAAVPRSRQEAVVSRFRGARGHDLGALRREYEAQARPMPDHLDKDFLRVRVWSSELRYEPGLLKTREAEAFLRAASAVIKWAEGRLP